MAKITKELANRGLKVILGTKTKPNMDVGFVCATSKGKGGVRSLFVSGRKKPSGLQSMVSSATWGITSDERKKSEDVDFKIIAHGTVKVEGSKIVLRFSKGSSTDVVKKHAKRFYKKELNKPFPWSEFEKGEDLTDDSAFVEGDDDDSTLPRDEEVEELVSAAADDDGDDDSSVSDDESDDEFEEVRAPSPTPGEWEKVEHPLAPEVETLLQTELKKQVDLLLQVSASIGLSIPGTADEIVAKLFGWLEKILMALPVEERLAAAANWLSRLQLAMNSSTQNMRDGTRVAKKKTDASSTGDGATAEGTDIIPGVDLNKLSTEPLSQQEVIEELKAYALSEIETANQKRGEAGQQLLDVGSADMAKIQTLVEKNWADGGEKQLATVNRYIGLFSKVCADEKSLINFLSIKLVAAEATTFNADASDAAQAAQEDDLVVEPAIADLKYNFALVSGNVKAVMDEAIKALYDAMGKTVEELGGSWNDVTAFMALLNIDPAVAALNNILNKTGEARKSAIANAKSVVNQLAAVLNDRMAKLLDDAPFTTQPGIVKLLGGSYKAIETDLNQLAASVKVAA